MSWLSITAWGGLVGLDGTSFPQLMIARPLVAGTVTGAVLGRPLDGLAIGAVLEVFALVVLPIGAARTPEAGTASVGAAAAYIEVLPAGIEPAGLLLATVFALGWEWVAGWSVHRLRQVNERIAPDRWARSAAHAAMLERRHLAAMALDFLRASAVTALGYVLCVVWLRAATGWWALDARIAFAALALAVAALLGAVLPLLGGWRRHRLAFGIGLVCGLAALLLG